MAKLSDPNKRQSHVDEPRTNLGHGRGNGRDWVDHGGRKVSGGPEPGAKGVSRSDGPYRAGTGKPEDIGR